MCYKKKHKTASLLFLSLITSICLVSGVCGTAQDKHIKNEGALTARTIERIAGESIAAPPKQVDVAGTKRVIGVDRRLQELSESILQCSGA